MKTSKKVVEKHLKMASKAIDLIKMSQRTQHTTIKEALKKILRCVSMLAEVGGEEKIKVTVNKSLLISDALLQKAKDIANKLKGDKDETNKTQS